MKTENMKTNTATVIDRDALREHWEEVLQHFFAMDLDMAEISGYVPIAEILETLLDAGMNGWDDTDRDAMVEATIRRSVDPHTRFEGLLMEVQDEMQEEAQ